MDSRLRGNDKPNFYACEIPTCHARENGHPVKQTSTTRVDSRLRGNDKAACRAVETQPVMLMQMGIQ